MIGETCQFNTVDDCLILWLGGFNGRRKKLLTVGIASVLWSIWKARNMACFQHVWPAEPFAVLRQTCYWIDHWSNWQGKEDAKAELQQAAKLLEQVAGEVFAARRRWAPWILKIGDG